MKNSNRKVVSAPVSRPRKSNVKNVGYEWLMRDVCSTPYATVLREANRTK